jgi:hypothetical protein
MHYEFGNLETVEKLVGRGVLYAKATPEIKEELAIGTVGIIIDVEKYKCSCADECGWTGELIHVHWFTSFNRQEHKITMKCCSVVNDKTLHEYLVVF